MGISILMLLIIIIRIITGWLILSWQLSRWYLWDGVIDIKLLGWPWTIYIVLDIASDFCWGMLERIGWAWWVAWVIAHLLIIGLFILAVIVSFGVGVLVGYIISVMLIWITVRVVDKVENMPQIYSIWSYSSLTYLQIIQPIRFLHNLFLILTISPTLHLSYK